ncbi:hypothetical protein [Saccharothrix luteola]|uniref:hypothetical protein n=1 Tax=Saccharothrix luteola TaxID=2893018 RepID=UPI001E5A4C5D|nr:hypothetical protein [Saccharothrix luteola]MCC8246710.1 hypothetical protein [Saccharothrix luteola]
MNAFFGELGKRLAERWVSLLVLPGVLFLATAAVGALLGHAHALDVTRLVARVDGVTRDLGTRPPAAQLLVLAAVLLGSVAAGLVVRALCPVTWRCFLGTRPRWAARRRRRRWVRAHERGEAAKRNRIALAAPTRATWTGDRLAAVEDRVHHQYAVDLKSWWARLWLVLDDSGRAELRAARAEAEAAVATTTWCVPYAVVGAFWWPAVVVAVCVAVVGWVRVRGAVEVYADLLEAVVDVHAGRLARELGAPLTTGEEVTAAFRKGT